MCIARPRSSTQEDHRLTGLLISNCYSADALLREHVAWERRLCYWSKFVTDHLTHVICRAVRYKDSVRFRLRCKSWAPGFKLMDLLASENPPTSHSRDLMHAVTE